MHKQALRDDEAANLWLFIVAAFWIIWLVSTKERSSLMQNCVQIHCSTQVILNAMATQYPCSFNGIYHPHWLVQWSRHCSHMLIPVHSPWPAGYIDVLQTILVIVTMAGLFLDRPHILNLCTFLCSMLIYHSIDFTFSFSPCYIKIIEKYLR